MSPPYIGLLERLVEKIEPGPGGCWLFTGSRNPRGYGRIRSQSVGRRNGGSGYALAHRVAYELFTGPIPADQELDHLCRIKQCVNPTHLEPVLHRVNVLRGEGPCALHARQSTCAYGHPLAGANLYEHALQTRGYRICRACTARNNGARRQKRAA